MILNPQILNQTYNTNIIKLNEFSKIYLPYLFLLVCCIISVLGYFIWGNSLIIEPQELPKEDEQIPEDNLDQIGEL